MSSRDPPTINLELHPKQSTALNTEATEVLFGGAAGGGKSHLMRCAAIIWCSMIPGLQVYLFRRLFPDLIKNHMEGPKGFRSLLAPWVATGHVSIVEDEIRFWNGSKIYLCHCKDEKDRFKYQGAEIHVLLIDELTHFTEVIYRFLRTRVRAVGLAASEAFKASVPRILCSSNPGNIGHSWVKKAFVEAGAYVVRQMGDSEGGMQRQFIPSRLDDNPSMSDDDPTYRARLRGAGSEALVKALEDGDWNVIEGAFFDCWSTEKHVVAPFAIPGHWLRFRSMDWGSAAPFSVGWWAVASESIRLASHSSIGPGASDEMGRHSEGSLRSLPRGALIRYREWYGTGQKLTAEEVAEGIKDREKTDVDEHGQTRISFGVLDPSAFAEDGGPSIAERMARNGVAFRRADNKRVTERGAMGGWDMMRARLKGDLEGNPMMVCFSTCVDSIRTIPVLQHDTDRPEDLDTEAEDHAADEWRYAAMARPWTRPSPEPDKPVIDTSTPTLAEVVRRTGMNRGRVGERI